MLEKKSYTLVFPEKILSPEVLGLITPPPLLPLKSQMVGSLTDYSAL